MSDAPPSEPASESGNDRPVVGTRSMDAAVSILVLALAVLLGWDSWRVGNSWASDGPQAGYFPFYLSVVMAVASLYGLARLAVSRAAFEPFVTFDQLGRVMKVLVPTFLFCLATQLLGLYVASFFLVAGFMWGVGRISPVVSFITALIFVVALFGTFEIAFNVIMPKGPLEAALGF